MMEKLKMQTPNLVDKNVEQIGKIFPEVITETKDDNGNLIKGIDFDLLKQKLSSVLVEDENERYRLDWPGKKASLLKANTPIEKTLRPVINESVDFEKTENLFIEGDNFEVLKILQESYLGKIKMICIDPPYNTGNDFIYKDDFKKSTQEYEEEIGTTDEFGGKLFKNTDSNGRFHSDWLNMMNERLLISKDLLSDEGVVFISIDDNEVHNLRKICDEIFGEENFVAQFVWAAGRKNDSKLVSVSHEYIICYIKSIDNYKSKNILWRERKQGLEEIYGIYEKLKTQFGNDTASIQNELKAWFKSLPKNHPATNHSHYSWVDSKGIYFPDNISWPGGGGPKYEVLHPLTQKPVKIPSRGWKTSDPKKMNEWVEHGLVHFGDDENSVPCYKSYLKDREYSVPYSVFYKDGRASTKRLRGIFEKDVFENPKDEEIIKNLIEFSVDKNDTIVDFFSGSATTAHAVIQINAEDGGTRKFIMVQLPEKTDEDSEAYKAGYRTIAEIGKERIRRVGRKIKEEFLAQYNKELEDINKELEQETLIGSEELKEKKTELESKIEHINNLDVGFRVYRTDSSNMKDVFYHPTQLIQQQLSAFESNIKEDRTPEDLLTQVILDLGLELSLSIERKEILGNNVFIVQENALVACFDDSFNFGIVDKIADIKPLRVVFKDASFKDDKDRVNVEERFKRLSPETIVSVI
jgi:adenine-specific DNA-methyltransferase